MIFLYLLLVILLIAVFVVFVSVITMQLVAIFTTDAPFVPVPNKTEDDIIKILELKTGSILYDLGCGDGRILIKAVEKHPEIKAVGVDVGFLPYLLAKFYTRNYKNIEVKREDIFKTDISPATHIFLYLYPKVINKLIINIRKQCKPNTRIVSCDFEFDNLPPTQTIELDTTSLRGKKLFVYSL